MNQQKIQHYSIFFISKNFDSSDNQLTGFHINVNSFPNLYIQFLQLKPAKK